jgi:hypothetical protein
MSTRTATGKGLQRPHKEEKAIPGIGASMDNAKSINTEKGGHNPKVGAGLPNTYFGNSRSINSDHHSKD